MLYPGFLQKSFDRHMEMLQFKWRWVYVYIGVIVCTNLIALLAYQHFLSVDFPFQDEWRYVDRLRQLDNTGFLHYLFDPDNSYFMPALFLIWYLFYFTTHLDIMAMRYAGAIISGAVALLLCWMLFRKEQRPNLMANAAILCGPFIVCSFNFSDSYNLASASLAAPLQWGIVLAACWSAEHTLRGRHTGLAASLCVACGIIASGFYPSGLVLLPAIVGARFLVRPRIDLSLVMLGLIAVLLAVGYLLARSSSGQVEQMPALTSGDLVLAVGALFDLVGNALFSPDRAALSIYTRLIGIGILLAQLVGMVHVLRLPADRRPIFLIPIILTLYNGMMFVEIAATRLHYPGFALYPRYSFLMMAGPLSLLFWVVTLADTVPWSRWLGIGTLTLLAPAVIMADIQNLSIAPYRPGSFANVRMTMKALHGEPTPREQKSMYLAPDMVPHVYPALEFLREHQLAMFRNTSIAITDYGPQPVVSNDIFNMQSGRQAGIRIRLNRNIQGDTFVVINGTQLVGVHTGDLVTAKVPSTVYAKSSTYSMYVLDVDGVERIESNRVPFIVNPASN